MGKAFVAIALVGTALGLAACATAPSGPTDARAAPVAAAAGDAAPGGVVRQGNTFATMADQYTSRAGPYAATGASAWVPTAPPPAFVATGPAPPADPPAPPPAAVANRQPAAPAPVPASEVVRPEAAAAPAAAPAAPRRDPAVRTAGLALFNANTCSACHAFADAGATGSVGPSLDIPLGVDTIVNAVTEGRGAMPSFRGAMSDAEIRTLATYLASYRRP
jgi:cytochrome c6